MQWLYDGLNGAFGHVAPQALQSADRATIETKFSEFYDRIESNIDRLPDMLNKRWDDAANDTDELIQDMLSVMDEDKVWDDYDDDLFSVIPDGSSKCFQDLVVPGNLEATIFGLARHDHVFRDRLRSAITKEICSDNFLLKLSARKDALLRRFDDYARRGPALKPDFVQFCANYLRRLISKLPSYLNGNRAPLSKSFHVKVAEFSVRVLEEICQRNIDIYEHAFWRRTEDKPEEERDRNLFVNLIKSPSGAASSRNFILDYPGEQLAPLVWVDLIGRLEPLLETLREQNAPDAYLQKLADMTALAQGGASLYGEPEEYDYEVGPMPAPLVSDSPADHRSTTSPPAGHSRSTSRRTTTGPPEAQRRRLH